MAKATRQPEKENPVKLRLTQYEADVLRSVIGKIGDGCYADGGPPAGPREAVNNIYGALAGITDDVNLVPRGASGLYAVFPQQ